MSIIRKVFPKLCAIVSASVMRYYDSHYTSIDNLVVSNENFDSFPISEPVNDNFLKDNDDYNKYFVFKDNKNNVANENSMIKNEPMYFPADIEGGEIVVPSKGIIYDALIIDKYSNDNSKKINKDSHSKEPIDKYIDTETQAMDSSLYSDRAKGTGSSLPQRPKIDNRDDSASDSIDMQDDPVLFPHNDGYYSKTSGYIENNDSSISTNDSTNESSNNNMATQKNDDVINDTIEPKANSFLDINSDVGKNLIEPIKVEKLLSEEQVDDIDRVSNKNDSEVYDKSLNKVPDDNISFDEDRISVLSKNLSKDAVINEVIESDDKDLISDNEIIPVDGSQQKIIFTEVESRGQSEKSDYDAVSNKSGDDEGPNNVEMLPEIKIDENKPILLHDAKDVISGSESKDGDYDAISHDGRNSIDNNISIQEKLPEIDLQKELQNLENKPMVIKEVDSFNNSLNKEKPFKEASIQDVESIIESASDKDRVSLDVESDGDIDELNKDNTIEKHDKSLKKSSSNPFLDEDKISIKDSSIDKSKIDLNSMKVSSVVSSKGSAVPLVVGHVDSNGPISHVNINYMNDIYKEITGVDAVNLNNNIDPEAFVTPDQSPIARNGSFSSFEEVNNSDLKIMASSRLRNSSAQVGNDMKMSINPLKDLTLHFGINNGKDFGDTNGHQINGTTNHLTSLVKNMQFMKAEYKLTNAFGISSQLFSSSNPFYYNQAFMTDRPSIKIPSDNKVNGASFGVHGNISEKFGYGMQFGLMSEENSMLLTRSSGPFALSSASNTFMVDANLKYNIADGISVIAGATLASTKPILSSESIWDDCSLINSSAFNIGLNKKGRNYSFGINYSQPMAINSGRYSASLSTFNEAGIKLDTRNVNLNMQAENREHNASTSYQMKLNDNVTVAGKFNIKINPYNNFENQTQATAGISLNINI